MGFLCVPFQLTKNHVQFLEEELCILSSKECYAWLVVNMIGQGHYALLGVSRKDQYRYVLFHDELVFWGNAALRMRLEAK